jgi:hypothetical protein
MLATWKRPRMISKGCSEMDELERLREAVADLRRAVYLVRWEIPAVVALGYIVIGALIAVVGVD